jgi:hypothetical protein
MAQCSDCTNGFTEELGGDQAHIQHMHNCPIYASTMIGVSFPCLYACGDVFITEKESLLHMDGCYGVHDTSTAFTRSDRQVQEKTDVFSFGTHTRSFLENLCSFNRFDDPLYLTTLGLRTNEEYQNVVRGRKNYNAEIKRTIYAMLSVATGVKTRSKSVETPSIDRLVGDVSGKTLWTMVTSLLPYIQKIPKQYTAFDNLPFAKVFTNSSGQVDEKLVHSVICLNRYVIAKLKEMGVTSKKTPIGMFRCGTCFSLQAPGVILRSNRDTLRCVQCVEFNDNTEYVDGEGMVLIDDAETFRISEIGKPVPSICGICGETRFTYLTCPIDRTHIYCKSCLVDQLTSQAGDVTNSDLASITCSMCQDGFTASDRLPTYTRSDVVNIIGPFLTTVHEDMQTYKVFDQVATQLFLCPSSCCRQAKHPPYEIDISKPQMTCPHCKTMFCTKCQKAAHASLSCEFAAQKSSTSDDILSQRLIENSTRPCPNPSCTYRIEKNGACFHMKCIACRTAFCWICGISYCDYYNCFLMGRIAPWSNASKRRFMANPDAVANWRTRYDGTRKLNGMYTIPNPEGPEHVILYDPPTVYPMSAYDANRDE